MMVVVADGAVVGSPDAATREAKIATVQSTVGVRRRSSPLPLPRRRPFQRERGRMGGWAGNEEGDDKAPRTMAAAAAALAALLTVCSAQRATRDLTMVGMCANVHRLGNFDCVSCAFSQEREKGRDFFCSGCF